MPLVKRHLEFKYEDETIVVLDSFGNMFLFEELIMLIYWKPK